MTYPKGWPIRGIGLKLETILSITLFDACYFFIHFVFFFQNVIIQLQKCLGTRDLHRRKIQTFNLTTMFERPCITQLVLNSGDLKIKGANVHI